MADKKITELELRSNVDDDVNIPVDDGIQSYRVTGPQVWAYIKAYIESFFASPTDHTNYSLAASVASSALTIALKDAVGNNPSAGSPVRIAFRSATLTDGKPVTREISAALSTVISSGSTAGHQNATDEYIYIYAIDNAGAVELAWSSTGGRDEGRLHSTTSEGGAGAADSRTVLYSTTARTNVALRFLGRFVSNQTTAGTYAAVPTAIGLRPVNPGLEENEIWYYGHPGEGSTDTTVFRYSTQGRAVGDAMTAVSNSTNGLVVTVNRRGLYSIFLQCLAASGNFVGITRNSTGLTSTINGRPVNEMLLLWEVSAANRSSQSIQVWLEVGDKIRVQCEAAGAITDSTDAYEQFRMVKIG